MIHLVIGPVGSGKSTFAMRLAMQHSAMRFTLDDWMVELFSPDRPQQAVMEWYVERAQRCVQQIWKLTENAMDVGTSVVLEIGLLQRNQREWLYERVDIAGHPLTIHVLDASRDVRRARVARRNQEQGGTFSQVVPPAIFELASNMWQPPEADECEGREVYFLDTTSSLLPPPSSRPRR